MLGAGPDTVGAQNDYNAGRSSFGSVWSLSPYKSTRTLSHQHQVSRAHSDTCERSRLGTASLLNSLWTPGVCSSLGSQRLPTSPFLLARPLDSARPNP